jgi:hypothetical protein
MATENPAKIRISLWKDFRPPRSLMLHEEHGKPVGSDDSLQQEIYSWSMREDPFGGIVDPELRSDLRDLLLLPFEPSKSPSDRRIEALEPFLQKADQAILDGSALWTTSQESHGEDDEFAARLNPLLALKIQLEWLLNCYSGHPSVSVAVR